MSIVKIFSFKISPLLVMNFITSEAIKLPTIKHIGGKTSILLTLFVFKLENVLLIPSSNEHTWPKYLFTPPCTKNMLYFFDILSNKNFVSKLSTQSTITFTFLDFNISFINFSVIFSLKVSISGEISNGKILSNLFFATITLNFPNSL